MNVRFDEPCDATRPVFSRLSPALLLQQVGGLGEVAVDLLQCALALHDARAAFSLSSFT